MIRAHLAAVETLLAPLAGHPPVIVGALDDTGRPAPAGPPATPYVLVRPDSMPLDSDRLAPWSNTVRGRLYVTSVGATVAEAQWAQERTRSVLVDARPVVVGRSVAPLLLVDGDPMRTDRDVTPPVEYVVDVYRYLTFPG